MKKYEILGQARLGWVLLVINKTACLQKNHAYFESLIKSPKMDKLVTTRSEWEHLK